MSDLIDHKSNFDVKIWDDDWADAPSPEHQFEVTLEGYEGPMDLLLELARAHKIDLTQIQILPLAEQYLAFIKRAQTINLEIAADYLVMAAWLGHLKSMLLLPKQAQADEEIDPEWLAQQLAQRLRHMQAIKNLSNALGARPRLGHDFFQRTGHEILQFTAQHQYEISLYELLSLYGKLCNRQQHQEPLRIFSTKLLSMEQALQRLKNKLGRFTTWTAFDDIMDDDVMADNAMDMEPATSDPLLARSKRAAGFAACLELARTGNLKMRQNENFSKLYLRSPV